MRKQHLIQMWVMHGKKHKVPPLKKLNEKRAFEAYITLKGPPLPFLFRHTHQLTGCKIYHNLNENVPPGYDAPGC